MNSKTLLFNKSVIKSNLKRFWWIAVLESIAIFVTTILPLIYNSYDVRSWTEEMAHARFMNSASLSMIWIVIFSIGTAILLFNYLYNAGSVSCIHGLPLKRKTLYISNISTGLFLLIIPVFVNVLVLIILKLTMLEVNYIVKFSFLLEWIFQYILYTLIVFSGTVFTSMLTGNAVASLAFSGIFALVPFFILAFTDFFLSQNLYGYYSQNLLQYTEYIYIFPSELMSYKCLIYIILSALLLIIGGLLYKIRKLENYGEILSFPKLKPIFIFCAAVCFGLLGYAYFIGINSIDSSAAIFVMLPFGIVGLIIAFMLSKKSFSLKGIVKHLVVYVVFVVAVFITIRFDITGFEKRVPAMEDIKSVSVVEPNYIDSYRYLMGEKVYYDDVLNPEMTTPEDIANVLALHEAKVAHGYTQDYIYDQYLPIIYTLNNGSQIKRTYAINYDEDKDLLAPIFESDIYRAYRYPILDGTEKNIHSVDFSYFDSYYISTDKQNEIDILVSALQQDLMSLKYDDFTWVYDRQSYPPIRLNVNYSKDGTSESGRKYPASSRSITESETYYITDKFVNTIDVLRELGYDIDLAADEIEAVGIDVYVYNYQPSEGVGSAAVYTKKSYDMEYDNPMTIDESMYSYVTYDKEEIQDILKYTENAYNNQILRDSRGSFEIFFHTKNGNIYQTTIDFGYEDLPETFQNIINTYYSR